eukprot:gene18156-biopygen27111
MGSTFARIDFAIVKDGVAIFLEVDENQPKFGGYSVACDMKRMANIYEALVFEDNTLSLYFIRNCSYSQAVAATFAALSTIREIRIRVHDKIEDLSVEDHREMTPFSGTFSYKNDNLYRRLIGDGVHMVMERLDPNIAKIRFEVQHPVAEDTQAEAPIIYQPIQIPEGVTLIVADSAIPAARIGNDFFIVTWIGNYLVLRGGNVLFRIFNQQSQAIQLAE